MKAVISGATRGIGRAIAIELAKKGFELILLARTEQDLESLLKELGDSSNQHEYLTIDLSDSNQLVRLDSILRQEEAIDLLINNLGVFGMDSPTDLDSKLLQELLNTNVFSAIELTRHLLPNLQNGTSSKIINIGSVHGLKADPTSISYSISKHALKAWADGLREELRPKNIVVSNIYPAAVNTSSWDGIGVNREAMIQAEDIAKLVSTLMELNPNCLVEEIRLSPMNF